MKSFWQVSRQFLVLLLVWTLSQLSPVAEFRSLSGGLVSAAVAMDLTNIPKVDQRLPDCKDYQPSSEHRGEGKCTVASASIDEGDGWMISEGYVSTLILWGVAIVFMYQVTRCVAPKVTCGYSTIASALGAAALLGGEIASIVGFATTIGKIKKTIEYRGDAIRKVQDDCISGDGSGSGSIGDTSACDQRKYLLAQRDALDGAKTAATWKFGLAIAAASCFGIAAIMELVAWIAHNTHDAIVFAAGNLTMAAIETASLGCAKLVGPPLIAACKAACTACTVGVEAAQGHLVELIAEQENLTPMTSILSCGMQQVAATGALTVSSAPCTVAAGAAGFECAAAASEYITELAAKVTEVFCPNQGACFLGCQPMVDEVMTDDQHYDVKRKTCEIKTSNVLQLSLGSLQHGDRELSLNQYLNVSKLPDIFFHESPAEISYLLNEEEVERETAQMQTEIDLTAAQEKLSFSDYRKIQQFYGDEMLSDHNFDFFKIIINQAVAAEGKNEDSGLPVNQIISGSLGLAGAAVLTLLGILKVTKLAADSAFSTPARRTGWNTLAAALAASQATYTKLGVMDILDDHIGKIDGILKQMEVASAGASIPDIQTLSSGIVTVNDAFFESPPPLPGNQTYPCAAGGDGKGGCNPVSNQLDSALGAVDLSSLAGLAGSLKSLNNGMQGRKQMAPGTMKNAATLASAARAVKKKIADLQKKINLDRQKNKQAPIDFAGNQTKTLKNLFKKAKDYLASKGVTAESLRPASPIEPIPQKELEKKLAEDLATGKQVAATGAVPKVTGLEGLNFENTAADAGGGALEVGDETAQAKNIDDSYEVPNNDISSDANADIFQMLSSRYLKTAYPILFEEQK